MRLGGLLKNTALDFPGKFSAAVFTQGCNFACPYCHNPHLVRLFGEPVDEVATLEFLRRRRPLLDGVVISGGEPTLQPDLAEFCKKLRGLGYEVKLDTNGSRPEVVADLIDRKLITYLALDLKADPAAYPPELAPNGSGEAVQETLRLLKRSPLPHEYRTTVAAPFVTRETIEAIARAAAGSAPLFLQPYRPDRTLDPHFMAPHPQPDRAALEEYRVIASRYLPTSIRG
ncbi:MAG: anaerobic ribonucleoside-triphosphate reductase activating protein [Candidatus Adiutrix sp.]|nr:anaerobic ribonucleoside-triphosphate reductase activating protein [Candidatus Adiutrix sp.]